MGGREGGWARQVRVTSPKLVGQMTRQNRGGPKTHDFDLRVVECIDWEGGEA